MSTFGQEIFASQPLGEETFPISPFPQITWHRIPLALIPTKSINGNSYPKTYRRDWRNGIYIRSDKEVTYQHLRRDPATGKFTNPQGQIIKYKYHRPVQPNSAPQLSRRQVFTNGVLAAQALTPEQRIPYNQTAKRKKAQTWFTIFMTEYLLNN